MTRYDGVSRDEHERLYRERTKLARDDARRRRARVLAVEEDGDWVTVEFTNDAGERIIGEYKIRGYAQPPAKLLNKMLENQRKATDPATTIGLNQTIARAHR